jgi:predicted ATPase
MYISHAQIENYKSFLKSPKLELSPGFNLITGANNAGKTALLECLGLRFLANPHRSTQTLNIPPNQESSVDISFMVDAADLWHTFKMRSPSTTYWIQLPHLASEAAKQVGLEGYTPDQVQKYIGWFRSQEVYRFDVRMTVIPRDDSRRWLPQSSDVSSLFSAQASGYLSSITVDPYTYELSGEGNTTQISSSSGIEEIGIHLASEFAKRVYNFRAERFAVGTCERGLKNETLLPDASNLANVLFHLQHNPSQFRDYMGAISQVLPQIQQIGVRPETDPKKVKIFVWTDATGVKKDELAFSLEECGTGVGQVLAILYIVYTASDPMTIIIDEPQSFLHPGAARKLIEILRNYSKHQYVIATHSPTIISAANAKSITMVKQEGSESTLQVLDVTKVENQTLYLNAIGAALSDVFGYDRILWVEGKTESTCFPVILERLAHQRLAGTAIVGIVNTGDLKGKDKRRALEIYQRLTSTTALIPPAIGFVFDSEGLTDREMKDLQRASNGKIHFLSRRMYENYLLHASAISALLATWELGDLKRPTEEEVGASLRAATRDKKYFRTTRELAKHDARDWQKAINGAVVLHDLFARVKVPYDKVIHGIWLTEWLIENQNDDLNELASFLTNILNLAARQVP